MDINTFLHIVIGFIGLVCLAIPFSNDIKKINIKHIIYGILFQLVLAFLLLEIPFITAAFNYLADGVSVLQIATSEGTKFVFGYLGIVDPNNGLIFAFVILPFIIVMSSVTAILWHWGILPLIVKGFSSICQKLFNIGGPIGLGGAANVFVGQVEAPLLIRPYLNKLTNKELLILMTAGMATVAGSIMVALVTLLEGQFDESTRLIQHFLTASILSVPAAIIYSNIMIPSNDVTNFDSDKAPKIYESTMDAITRGTSDGLNIAMNVGAILIAFIALVYIFDAFLGFIPNPFGDKQLSLQILLGYLFAPIAWLMGIPWKEAIVAGELLGVKTALNEFVAYISLANLEDGLLSERSKLITLYGLCGFANFSSIGILVSGISAMAPERKNDLIKVSFKALIGGTLASCMSGLVIACFI
jgi:CNT family concentrative nucleoside transporter